MILVRGQTGDNAAVRQLNADLGELFLLPAERYSPHWQSAASISWMISTRGKAFGKGAE
jgi:hypothetical protein